MTNNELNDLIRQYGNNYPSWVKQGIGKNFDNIIDSLKKIDSVVSDKLITGIANASNPNEVAAVKTANEQNSTTKDNLKKESKKRKIDEKSAKKELSSLKERSSVKKALGNKIKNLGSSLERVTSSKQDVDFIDMIEQAGMSTNRFSKSLGGSGSSLLKSTSLFVVGAGLAVLGISKLLKTIRDNREAYSNMIESGVALEDGFSGFFKSASKSGLTFSEFGAVITKNHKLFSYLGTTGPKEFAELSRGMLDNSNNIIRFGMKLEDINDYLVDFLEYDRITGLMRNLTEDQRTKEIDRQLGVFTQYSFILGKSKDQLLKQLGGIASLPNNVLLSSVLSKGMSKSGLKSISNLQQTFKSLTGIIDDEEALNELANMGSVLTAVKEGNGVVTAEMSEMMGVYRQYSPELLTTMEELVAAGDDEVKVRKIENKLISILASDKTLNPTLLGNAIGTQNSVIMSHLKLRATLKQSLLGYQNMSAEDVEIERKKREEETKKDGNVLSLLNEIDKIWARINSGITTMYEKILSTEGFKQILAGNNIAMNFVMTEIDSFFRKKKGLHTNESEFDKVLERLSVGLSGFFKYIDDLSLKSTETETKAVDTTSFIENCIKPLATFGVNVYNIFGPTGLLLTSIAAPIVAGIIATSLAKLTGKIIMRSLGFRSKASRFAEVTRQLKACTKSKNQMKADIEKKNGDIGKANKKTSKFVDKFKSAAKTTGEIIHSTIKSIGSLTVKIAKGLAVAVIGLGVALQFGGKLIAEGIKKLGSFTNILRRFSAAPGSSGPRARPKGRGLASKGFKYLGKGAKFAGKWGGRAIAVLNVIEMFNMINDIPDNEADLAEFMKQNKQEFDLLNSELEGIMPNWMQTIFGWGPNRKKDDPNAESKDSEFLRKSLGNRTNSLTPMSETLPGLAKGGVVTGDTLARIGEGSSPEVVMPLDPSMNKLAKQIAKSIVQYYAPVKRQIYDKFVFNFIRKNMFHLDNILTNVYDRFFFQKNEISKVVKNAQSGITGASDAIKTMAAMGINPPAASSSNNGGSTNNAPSDKGGGASYVPTDFGPNASNAAGDVKVEWALGPNRNFKPLPQISNLITNAVSKVSKSMGEELGLVFTSGMENAHPHGPKQFGSKRHGTGLALDFKLKRGGELISPTSDKKTYLMVAQALKSLGAKGLGHYSWGMHADLHSDASWGPDTSGRSLDPQFRDAIEYGRKNPTTMEPPKTTVAPTPSATKTPSPSPTSAPSSSGMGSSSKRYTPKPKTNTKTSGLANEFAPKINITVNIEPPSLMVDEPSETMVSSNDTTSKEQESANNEEFLVSEMSAYFDTINKNFDKLNTSTRSSFGILA